MKPVLDWTFNKTWDRWEATAGSLRLQVYEKDTGFFWTRKTGKWKYIVLGVDMSKEFDTLEEAQVFAEKLTHWFCSEAIKDIEKGLPEGSPYSYALTAESSS